MEYTTKDIIKKGRELWEEDCKRFNAIHAYHKEIGFDFISYSKRQITLLSVYIDAVIDDEETNVLLNDHYDELEAGGRYTITSDGCLYEINNDEDLLIYINNKTSKS